MGLREFAKLTEEPGQLFGLHAAQQGVGPFGQSGIHPHVEAAVAPGAEAAVLGVELVRADAQVGEDAVHLLHALEAKEVGGEPKVLRDEVEPRVVGDVVGCIGVAIESEQASLGA